MMMGGPSTREDREWLAELRESGSTTGTPTTLLILAERWLADCERLCREVERLRQEVARFSAALSEYQRVIPEVERDRDTLRRHLCGILSHFYEFMDQPGFSGIVERMDAAHDYLTRTEG